jgi:hypothetical protein
MRFGYGHTRLADTSIVVVVELIKRVLLHPGLLFFIEVGSKVFESVKVLSNSLNKRLEASVILGASPEGKEKRTLKTLGEIVFEARRGNVTIAETPSIV